MNFTKIILEKLRNLNWVLFSTMIGMLVFGVFAIYSASYMRDNTYLANSWNRQVIWILLGLVVFFVTSLIDYRWVRWGAVPAFLGGLVVLLLVKVLGTGDEEVGAKSWLDLGPFTLQGSQVAIIAGILMLSFVLTLLPRKWKFFRKPYVQVAICGIIAIVPFGLVLLEPDPGSASMWIPVTMAIMLVARVPFRYFAVIFLCGMIVLPLAYNFGLKNYQKERIQVFLGVLDDPQGAGWASRWIRIAVGSGGFTGKGFKAQESLTQIGRIPPKVAINDFIFAVVAEEQGFRGAVLLLSGYTLLLLLSLFIAFYSRDDLGRLIVVGVVALIGAHVFMNIGMNVGLTPITGIPLPFISYGGTFILMLLFSMGLVQSVWIHRAVELPRASDQIGA